MFDATVARFYIRHLLNHQSFRVCFNLRCMWP